jgi:N-acetylglucosamine-6-phosphate deacetylase
MATALVNGRVLVPGGIRDDLCVLVEGERIAAVVPEAPRGSKRIDLGGQFLLPGFIDVQVNGGGGRLFNDDPTVETIAAIAAAHRRFGTTGLLPTLISDDVSVIERGIAAVDEAIERRVPGVLGIHIEGPFLSTARRGIHLASMLRAFDDSFIDLLSSAHRFRPPVSQPGRRTFPLPFTRDQFAGSLRPFQYQNVIKIELDCILVLQLVSDWPL